ncbi:hypothetical protein PUV44_23345 [Xanthomonas arboricola pv. corylina]|nr:hypothetical protein PUV44_23345 [Xanthomonas arboricola pv. corylina]
MKVRIYLLEAGMAEDVEVRDFVPGTPQEENIRAEIAPYLDKVSFPSAQLGPERYVAESDNIIAFLVLKSGHEPASLTVFPTTSKARSRR